MYLGVDFPEIVHDSNYSVFYRVAGLISILLDFDTIDAILVYVLQYNLSNGVS